MLLLKGVIKLVEVSIALLFFALAFFMLQGKGAFLIAGFNTLSKEEQAKYDKARLTKFMGKLMLIIGICLVLMAFDKAWLTYSSIAIMLLAITFALIYSNTGERFQKHE